MVACQVTRSPSLKLVVLWTLLIPMTLRMPITEPTLLQPRLGSPHSRRLAEPWVVIDLVEYGPRTFTSPGPEQSTTCGQQKPRTSLANAAARSVHNDLICAVAAINRSPLV